MILIKFVLCVRPSTSKNNCSGMNDEFEITRLRQHLKDGYDKNNRAVIETVDGNLTHVYVILLMGHINDFDEVNGHAKTTSYIKVGWRDPRLSWNTSEYPVTDHITINLKDIWIPHVILWNPIDNYIIVDPENDQQLVLVYPNGWVTYTNLAILSTLCVPNVEFFPFDKHNCDIELLIYESLFYGESITVQPHLLDLKEQFNSSFSEHPQWKLIPGTSHTFNFSKVVIVRFPFIFQRRGSFMLFNLVFPVMLISLLNVCAFAIPFESGERVSFAMSVFLSVLFYMTIVADFLPHSASPMPLWSWYLLFKISCSAIITLSSIRVIQLSKRHRTLKMSRCLDKIVKFGDRFFLRRDFFRQRTRLKRQICKKADCMTCGQMDSKSRIECWEYAAYILDEMCMTVFLIISVTDFGFLGYLYTKI